MHNFLYSKRQVSIGLKRNVHTHPHRDALTSCYPDIEVRVNCYHDIRPLATNGTGTCSAAVPPRGYTHFKLTSSSEPKSLLEARDATCISP
jgi:hypothetical protein